MAQASRPHARFARAFVAFGSLVVAAAAPASAQDLPNALPVEVLEVEILQAAEITEYFPGLVAARRESQLGFESGGRIASVEVDVGDYVELGDALAALDVRALDARIAAAEAQVREAEASLALARATSNRQGELVDRGVASQQVLDEASANVNVAAARLAAASAQLDELAVLRDLSLLTAPYAGVIVARFMDEGDIAAPGAPALDLVEIAAPEVRVGLPLHQAERLSPGAEVTFVVDDQSVAGTLRAATGVVDRATQTVTAIFDVEPGSVAPGEVARLRLNAAVEAEGFWVPLIALTESRRGLWSVLALAEPDEEGGYRLEPRTVDIIYTEADRVFVRGAVQDGDLVLAGGRDRVVPGQRVRPAARFEFDGVEIAQNATR